MAVRRRSSIDFSMIVIAVLAMAAGIHVYWRDGPARFQEILFADLDIFAAVLPKVLAGCLLGAFITLLLPREMVTRWIGSESGILGIVIATALGAVFPGGPFTIYPVAAAFLAVGADVGAATAFVISWTLIGYNRALVWELPFFGLEFVGWRILFCVPLPILAGLLARPAWRALNPKAGDDS